MTRKTRHTVGWTRDVGFQIGVRRTLEIPLEQAWRYLTSVDGLRIWLGDFSAAELTPGATYELADGSSGEIRVLAPNSHLRMTWQPRGWQRPSTIQLRVIPKGERTTIAFHQERLPGAKEREERRAYYAAVLDELERIFQE